MICKECGAKIENLTRICPHCGGRALVDDELETWSFIADTAASKRHAMPEEVALNAPCPPPETTAAQLAGLERLRDYFVEYSNLYQVADDLQYIESGFSHPSFLFWGLAGGLAAALVYFPLSPFLPHFVWTYYFVLWAAVSVIGYLRAGRRYERRAAEYAVLRRQAENDLHVMYNHCEGCFLPLEWTPPPRINRMIAALRTGEVRSVQDYIGMDAPMKAVRSA